MSVLASTWAWQQIRSGRLRGVTVTKREKPGGRRGSPPAAKVVLLALADWADDNGECFPGQATIAAKCDLDTSSVQRAIAVLVKLKLVSYQRRFDAAGDPTSNLYRLQLPHVEAVVEADRPVGGGDRNLRLPLNGDRPPVDNSVDKRGTT